MRKDLPIGLTFSHLPNKPQHRISAANGFFEPHHVGGVLEGDAAACRFGEQAFQFVVRVFGDTMSSSPGQNKNGNFQFTYVLTFYNWEHVIGIHQRFELFKVLTPPFHDSLREAVDGAL